MGVTNHLLTGMILQADPASHNSKVQSVQFDETSHSITDGQPYDGVFSLGIYLDVRAGRHGSAEVAHDFNAGITPDNGLGLATSKSDSPLPSDLNFALSLSLGRPWWCHSWPETLLLWWVIPGSALVNTDCTGPPWWQKQLVDRRHKVLS